MNEWVLSLSMVKKWYLNTIFWCSIKVSLKKNIYTIFWCSIKVSLKKNIYTIFWCSVKVSLKKIYIYNILMQYKSKF